MLQVLSTMLREVAAFGQIVQRNRTAAIGRDGMDTALPSGMKGQAARKGPSRTERHRSAKVEL
jgi:hypothetical protein